MEKTRPPSATLDDYRRSSNETRRIYKFNGDMSWIIGLSRAKMSPESGYSRKSEERAVRCGTEGVRSASTAALSGVLDELRCWSASPPDSWRAARRPLALRKVLDAGQVTAIGLDGTRSAAAVALLDPCPVFDGR